MTLLPRASILIRATPQKQAYIGLLQINSECPADPSVLLEVGVAVEQFLSCPAAYRQITAVIYSCVMVSLRHAAIERQILYCTLVFITNVQVSVDVLALFSLSSVPICLGSHFTRAVA